MNGFRAKRVVHGGVREKQSTFCGRICRIAAGRCEMEELKRLNDGDKGGVSRREFLGKTAVAAAGFSIVPRHVLGGPGFVPPSVKACA
jgi:hypothetical protein